MKVENDKIIIESRREIDMLQNIFEGFYAMSKCVGEEEERTLAKELSSKLDAMYMSW